jgi:hypothetical protein
MGKTKLIIRLIGLGEARAEGIAAAIILAALAALAMGLFTLGNA